MFNRKVNERIDSLRNDLAVIAGGLEDESKVTQASANAALHAADAANDATASLRLDLDVAIGRVAALAVQVEALRSDLSAFRADDANGHTILRDSIREGIRFDFGSLLGRVQRLEARIGQSETQKPTKSPRTGRKGK